MIDHLVYGVPDLAQGVDRLERQTGVRARLGGRHPGRGTHNALLSLGPRQYLEVSALDADAAGANGVSQTTLIADEGGRWVGLATGLAPGVADNPRPMLVGMFVVAEARRRGAAVALVEGVADWVRSQGARCLVLWVRDNNAAAAALYRKCGFRATGLRRAVALVPALAEIEMLRELNSGAR